MKFLKRDSGSKSMIAAKTGKDPEKNSVGLGKRLLALVLDLLIINAIILYPFRNAFMRYFGDLSSIKALSSEVALPSELYGIFLVISLLVLLYFTFFDYYLSQTPGKMITKIKTISTNGKDITMMKSLLKNCFVLPFFPFYLFWFIEPIYLSFYGVRLLEKMTSTRTVNQGFSSKDEKEFTLEKVR